MFGQGHALWATLRDWEMERLEAADEDTRRVSSPTDMSTFLENNFPALATSDANRINELYPKGAQFSGRGEFFSAAAAAYGEMRYICPGILVSTNIAKFQAPKPTWNYQYVSIVSIQAYLILQQL